MSYRPSFLIATVIAIVWCQDYDCNVQGVKGKCIDIRSCPSAQNDLKQKIMPKICSFTGASTFPNVCCLESVTNVTTPSSDDVLSTTTATPYAKGCPPKDTRFTPRIKPITQGFKAWAKCLEYQNTALFPCNTRGIEFRCDTRYSAVEYLGPLKPEFSDTSGGGKTGILKEFPHMALLGYGKDPDSAEWLCGGSLISENFILTAAHCISAEDVGTVTYVALGALERTESRKYWDIYKIINIIRHPGHKPPAKYNDIALLQTETNVRFSRKVVPACLHVGDEVIDYRASASGWGAFGHRKPLADIMQYVPLWKLSDEECSLNFPPHRHYKQGINKTTQMCYGDDGHYVRDTCMGDSGGPLQIVSNDIYCMYLILGVTSFGQVNCATLGSPGLYTRVYHYVPWIESIVWPSPEIWGIIEKTPINQSGDERRFGIMSLGHKLHKKSK